MDDNQKVLITGNLGFIFSNFVRYVAYNRQKGYNWITIDNHISPLSAYNRYASYGFRGSHHHIADIADASTIDAIFRVERPDLVIHAAAQTSVDKSLTQSELFERTNVQGTKAIVDACVKWEVKKLIHISTDEVYGSLTNENDPSWTELSTINPKNPYSISKAKAEQTVINAGKEYGLIYNIVRPSNNFGERQTYDKLIPLTIKNVLDNKKIPIYGDGMQIRDWLYVGDNCAAILMVIEKGAPNEIYNIGANQEMTNIEIVQRICKILEQGYDLIEHIPDPRGKYHDFRYSMDCSKIRTLGWAPRFRLNDGLYQTCDWYKKNLWARNY